jgi:hypothetical protein
MLAVCSNSSLHADPRLVVPTLLPENVASGGYLADFTTFSASLVYPHALAQKLSDTV